MKQWKSCQNWMADFHFCRCRWIPGAHYANCDKWQRKSNSRCECMTLLYHYHNNVLLWGHNAEEIWGIFFFITQEQFFYSFFFWQDCHKPSVSRRSSYFPSQVRRLPPSPLLPEPGSRADDGNNAQGGLSDDALIWCDSKCRAGWQRESVGCAHSRPDGLQDAAASDRQHISRLDISACDRRSAALRRSHKFYMRLNTVEGRV